MAGLAGSLERATFSKRCVIEPPTSREPDRMALVVAILFTSTVTLGCMAGPVLNALGWPLKHPGTAAACWMAAVGGTVVGFAGAVAVALLHSPAPGHGLLEMAADDVAARQCGGPPLAGAIGTPLTIVAMAVTELYHPC